MYNCRTSSIFYTFPWHVIILGKLIRPIMKRNEKDECSIRAVDRHHCIVTVPFIYIQTWQATFLGFTCCRFSEVHKTLPSLLPFLGIAINEPRLPPITLWGLLSGGFLKDPVYWWRKECILWDVGGLPFFTIGSRNPKGQERSMPSEKERF